jgi:two-component system, sensor histidine kinase and response regulator
MDSLRFLLVHADASQSERISSILEDAHHTVLPASGLDEASEALSLERFDAVLLGSPFATGTVSEFKTKLRQIEQRQRSTGRVPILSFLAGQQENPCDGYLEEPLDLAALTAAVDHFAHASDSGGAQTDSDLTDSLPILEPDEFEEQVGGDRELMVEIIDLFLEERKRQEVEMRESVSAANWAALSALAHTIKGSLGSLHAPRARARAQELEVAARDKKAENCACCYAQLERDLEELEPELVALRAVSV